MLRALLNKSWKRHPTKQQLYSHPPPTSKIIQIRGTKHVGQFWRSKDELIRNDLLWTPSHGCASIERAARTYLQQIYTDTGCSHEDLPEAIDDRDWWWERVKDIRACWTSLYIYIYIYIYIYLCVCVCACMCVYPIPLHEQDETRGHFFSKIKNVWIQSFPFLRLVAITRLKSPVCLTIYRLLEGE